MRVPSLLILVLGGLAGSAVHSASFETPEDAVRSLEAAYTDKNLDAAVAAKDFDEEARLMLTKINPSLAADTGILSDTAHVLELSFRKQLKTDGFPDFNSLKCSFVDKHELSPTLVSLTEKCVFPDGGKSTQELFVAKGKRGWRMVTMPPAEK
jgi:hypothetical protein